MSEKHPPRPITVTIFKSKGLHRWRFRVVGANGEKLAQSEGYRRRIDAVHGAALVVGPDVPIDVGDVPIDEA
jgi:uncharacterized protein YegP (UPF0339 family)